MAHQCSCHIYPQFHSVEHPARPWAQVYFQVVGLFDNCVSQDQLNLYLVGSCPEDPIWAAANFRVGFLYWLYLSVNHPVSSPVSPPLLINVSNEMDKSDKQRDLSNIAPKVNKKYLLNIRNEQQHESLPCRQLTSISSLFQDVIFLLGLTSRQKKKPTDSVLLTMACWCPTSLQEPPAAPVEAPLRLLCLSGMMKAAASALRPGLV